MDEEMRRTDPHMEGTMKSLVFVQYWINLWTEDVKISLSNSNGLPPPSGAVATHDIEASETLMRGRSRSSRKRELSSLRRRSFKSAMDCFLFFTSPPARIS